MGARIETYKLPALDIQSPRPTQRDNGVKRTRGRIDYIVLILTTALVIIGAVMVYSASSFSAEITFGTPTYYFQKELLSIALGIVLLIITSLVDYRIWRRFSLWGMTITLVLLIIVMVAGEHILGASRWIAIGRFFSFQPSELAKLALCIYIADWLARKGNQVRNFLYGLVPFVILVGFFIGLVLLENDMGTAIIIAALATAMFFAAGANVLQFGLAAILGLLAFIPLTFHGYRYYRLIGFLQPFQNITGINLQLYQSLLGFGSGGIFGVGLGAGQQKAGYLPLPYTDSIFSIIGEELGFIGCICIILLFLCLAYRGFKIARRSNDMYGTLLATGITTWIIIQALINIGANTASIPYTGVPLPFISFGGSSMVVTLAAIGILLNISRYTSTPEQAALSRKSVTGLLKKAKPSWIGRKELA